MVFRKESKGYAKSCCYKNLQINKRNSSNKTVALGKYPRIDNHRAYFYLIYDWRSLKFNRFFMYVCLRL